MRVYHAGHAEVHAKVNLTPETHLFECEQRLLLVAFSGTITAEPPAAAAAITASGPATGSLGF